MQARAIQHIPIRRPAVILKALALLLVSDMAGAADYPVNPSTDPDSIYLSDTGVTRIERSTLGVVWTSLTHLQTFEPVLTESHLVVGSSAGLHLLDKHNGAVVRSLQPDRTLYSPVVENDIAYVGAADGALQAIDLTNGNVLWRRTFNGWVYPPALSGQHLIAGGHEPYVHGLDKATGATLWRTPVSQELFYRPLSVTAGGVLISTFGSEVQLIDAYDGQTVWSHRAGVPGRLVAADDDQVIIGLMDGTVRSLRLRDGATRWSYSMGGGLLSIGYFPEQSAVLAAGDGGALVRLDVDEGRVLWIRSIDEPLAGEPLLTDSRVVIFTAKRANANGRAKAFDSLDPPGRL